MSLAAKTYPWLLACRLERPRLNIRWTVPLLLVVLGFAAIPVDLPIARFCLARNLPGELRDLFERCETFGHAQGVVLIAVTVALVTPYGWSVALRLGAVALTAGIAADVMKIFLFRIRPCRMGNFPIDTIGDTFQGFLPWMFGDASLPFWDASYHSLPSAHTATAVALACGLAYLFHRGWMWFFFLAFLTAANRVDGGAHFLSDTCWGAALGFCVGQWASERWLRSARLAAYGHLS